MVSSNVLSGSNNGSRITAEITAVDTASQVSTAENPNSRLQKIRKMLFTEKQDKLLSAVIKFQKRQPREPVSGLKSFLKRIEPAFNFNTPTDKLRNSGLRAIEAGNRFRTLTNAKARLDRGSFLSRNPIVNVKTKQTVVLALQAKLAHEQRKPEANRSIAVEAALSRDIRVLMNPEASMEHKDALVQSHLNTALAYYASALVSSVDAYIQRASDGLETAERPETLLDSKTYARFTQAVQYLEPQTEEV